MCKTEGGAGINNTVYILNILLYVVFIVLTWYLLSVRLKIKLINSGELDSSLIKAHRKLKMGYPSIIFISILLGLYSAFVAGKVPYSSDRGNYALRFYDYWVEPWTPGLNIIGEILHLFTNKPEALFFTISFLCALITLIACRMYAGTTATAILLLVISNHFISSFYLLKQAPSVAMGLLAFVALSNKRWFLCIVCLFISISFHEAAFILIPLFLVMLRARSKMIRSLVYITLLICILFFESISIILLNIIGIGTPDLYKEIESYLDPSGGIETSNNLLTIIKGVPIYLITIGGLLFRKRLISVINNYDQKLMICIFASVMTILSVYMYWMMRFSMYAYLPMFIFWAEIIGAHQTSKEIRLINLAIIVSMSFFTFRYLFQIFFLYGGF